MKPSALMIAIGKPKGGDEPADESESAEKAPDEESSEDEYAGIAFDALKDGDKDAFIDAFKGAVKARVQAEDAGEYEKG